MQGTGISAEIPKLYGAILLFTEAYFQVRSFNYYFTITFKNDTVAHFIDLTWIDGNKTRSAAHPAFQ